MVELLTSDAGTHDSRAEIFEAIGHPTRIRILQVLNDQPMGFADLKRAVGIESSGNMTFHLTKLRNLVRTGPNGNYVLTDDGREALWSIGNISGASREPGSDWQVRRRGRNRQRVIVSSLVVVLLILGSVALLQQEQLGIEQGQVVSQQQQLALYVKQAGPYTSGQSASLVLGQKDFVSYASATSQSGMNNPAQVLFDSSGNLWIADFGNMRVTEFKPPFSNGMSASLVLGQRNFTTAEGSTTKEGLGGFPGPTGIAFDSSGNLWVADFFNNRVVEFKPPFTNGMSASIVIGQPDFTSSDRVGGQNGLHSPAEVVFDSSGNLWVIDAGNNRVLEFKPPFNNGMNASLVIGQVNFEDSLPSATQSGLDCEYGDLAIDTADNLWVGDTQNSRLLEFRPPFSSGMRASIVIGQPNFTARARAVIVGYGGVSLGWNPAFDPDGNLWVSVGSRMLEFKPPFVTNMRATLEIGQPDFTSSAWVGGQSGLILPAHPGFDLSGNLWVPDSDNHRVLEFAAGSSTVNVATAGGAVQPLGQFQLVAIGAVMIAVGLTSTGVYLRRRRSQNTQKQRIK